MNYNNDKEKPTFIAEIQLGRVVKYLRFAGFDTQTLHQASRRELLRLAEEQGSVLLTSARTGEESHALCISLPSSDLSKALKILNERFSLAAHYAPFTRCIRCNTSLEVLRKPPESLPAFVLEHFREFRCCPSCEKVYWKGSHYRRMETKWQEVFQESGP